MMADDVSRASHDACHDKAGRLLRPAYRPDRVCPYFCIQQNIQYVAWDKEIWTSYDSAA